MGTNRSNRTNRQLGEGTLELQRVTTIQVPLMRCISPFDNVSCHMGTNRTNRTNRQLVLDIFKVPLMRCISPFDSGSYHMGTIRTNRTNRQLGEGLLGLHRVRNILSPPNEIQFSIRQRVVPHGHDLYESTATAQPFYDSYLFRCIGQPSRIQLMLTINQLMLGSINVDQKLGLKTIKNGGWTRE